MPIKTSSQRRGPHNILNRMISIATVALVFSTFAGRFIAAANSDPLYLVSTLAGRYYGGNYPYPPSANGVGSFAFFHEPNAVYYDGASDLVYVGDNGFIRVIDPSTKKVTTLAGKAPDINIAWPTPVDGVGTYAVFSNQIYGLIVAKDLLFVSDAFNSLLRTVDPTSGIVETVAGSGNQGCSNGLGTFAELITPRGLSFEDPLLYFADQGCNTIRTFDTNTGVVDLLAGYAGYSYHANGVGNQASFFVPTDVQLVPGTSMLLVADSLNSLIRMIDVGTARVTTFAGNTLQKGRVDGVGTYAQFYIPTSIAVTADGLLCYVMDENNSGGAVPGPVIRVIDIPSGIVTTIVGSGSTGSGAPVNSVGTFAVFNTGVYSIRLGINKLYTTDPANYIIRQVEVCY